MEFEAALLTIVLKSVEEKFGVALGSEEATAMAVTEVVKKVRISVGPEASVECNGEKARG